MRPVAFVAKEFLRSKVNPWVHFTHTFHNSPMSFSTGIIAKNRVWCHCAILHSFFPISSTISYRNSLDISLSVMTDRGGQSLYRDLFLIVGETGCLLLVMRGKLAAESQVVIKIESIRNI